MRWELFYVGNFGHNDETAEQYKYADEMGRELVGELGWYYRVDKGLFRRVEHWNPDINDDDAVQALGAFLDTGGVLHVGKNASSEWTVTKPIPDSKCVSLLSTDTTFGGAVCKALYHELHNLGVEVPPMASTFP